MKKINILKDNSGKHIGWYVVDIDTPREVFYNGTEMKDISVLDCDEDNLLCDLLDELEEGFQVVKGDYEIIENGSFLIRRKIDKKITTVKEARLAVGISQAELSILTNIPKRTIEDWEAGKFKIRYWVKMLVIEKILSFGFKDEYCFQKIQAKAVRRFNQFS